MRTVSAHSATHKGKRPLQKVPRIGTKLREIYELFQMNKGVVIEAPLTVLYNQAYITYLTDFYGLDIRRIGNIEYNGHRGRRAGKWILAGEWFGSEYVDYISRNKKKLNKVGQTVANE